MTRSLSGLVAALVATLAEGAVSSTLDAAIITKFAGLAAELHAGTVEALAAIDAPTRTAAAADLAAALADLADLEPRLIAAYKQLAAVELQVADLAAKVAGLQASTPAA
jgi:hypothetical protein